MEFLLYIHDRSCIEFLSHLGFHVRDHIHGSHPIHVQEILIILVIPDIPYIFHKPHTKTTSGLYYIYTTASFASVEGC
jgi:hypothetical protein